MVHLETLAIYGWCIEKINGLICGQTPVAVYSWLSHNLTRRLAVLMNVQIRFKVHGHWLFSLKGQLALRDNTLFKRGEPI